ITIKTNAGGSQVSVTMLIASPSMSISPTSLDFGTTTTQRNFTITNTGGGTLTWSIGGPTFPSWLSANPTSGSLTAGNSISVTVIVNRSGMNPGDYKTDITVNSNSGSGQVSVTMSVPRPSLSLSPTRLNFGDTETLLDFRIINTGGGTLTWNVVSNRDWLFISRDIEEEGWKSEINGGTTGPYGTTRIYVRVVRRGNPGTYTGAINITSNGSPVANGTVDVSMIISRVEIPGSLPEDIK
ncbi:MAG: BACON domain-containing protein, partial [Candidatus Poribacteria bacterium]